MINHSLPALLFIRACIYLLQYAPLIEATLLILCLFLASRTPQSQPGLRTTLQTSICVLAALHIAEAIYYITYYRPHRSRLLRSADHPPPLSKTERRRLFERCVTNVSDWNHYLRLWFLMGKPEECDTSGKVDDEMMSQIKRDNIREFLLWAFFDHDDNYHDDELDWEDEEEVQRFIARVEQLIDRKFEPGRAEATSLRLTIDKVDVRYRTVLWYGIVAFVDFVTYIRLRFYGFTHYNPRLAKNDAAPTTTVGTAPERLPPLFPPRVQSLLHLRPPNPFAGAKYRHYQTSSNPAPGSVLGYWHRPHRSQTHRPILFIHGIGIGLYPYASFLSELNKVKAASDSHDSSSSNQIGIIALEIMPMSTRLTTPPLSQDAFLEQVQSILSLHHPQQEQSSPWSKFTLVSHSYGSVLSTHILHSPELGPRVAGLVLIDPVSILLHLPDVAYNFTRRPPRTANEWQLWYFASTDMGVAEGLGRHFFWRENVVWREELVDFVRGDRDGKKRKVAVCLSGRDLIVDTRSVARYLEGDRDLRELGATGELERGEEMFGDGNCTVKSRSDPGLEVLWFGRLDHAQVFDTREDRAKVVDVVRRFCRLED